jgi:DNA (cytosine-5)-methyltransferase 1
VVKPTVISLFAGCGGSSLGYQMAGFKELLAVEWDDNAVETFKLNFPDIPVYHGDITKLSSQECMKLAGIKEGELDILDGSPPCQGFSTAGKRRYNDPRNSLFQEYARLLKDLQPKVFVFENVSGMVKGYMKQIYLEVIKELRECGYNCKGQVLNAMYFNVPQSRERVIIIGVREDLVIEPSHPKPQTEPITFRKAVEGLPLSKQIHEIDHVWIDEVKRKTKWIERAMNLRPGEKLVPDVASGRRLFWDKPSSTIQRNAPPGCAPYVRNSQIHPSEPRTPSIREMARCQGFPDSFRFIDALTEGMARIGNSVPPPFMKAIAEHIKVNILDFTGRKAELSDG